MTRLRKMMLEELIVRYEPEKAVETLPLLVADRKDRNRLLTLLERVLADPRRTAQVLANLIANASRYAPEATTVTVATEGRDGFVQVSVVRVTPDKLHSGRTTMFKHGPGAEHDLLSSGCHRHEPTIEPVQPGDLIYSPAMTLSSPWPRGSRRGSNRA